MEFAHHMMNNSHNLEDLVYVGAACVSHLHGLWVEVEHEIVQVVAHRGVVYVLVDEVEACAAVESVGLGDEVPQGILEL